MTLLAKYAWEALAIIAIALGLMAIGGALERHWYVVPLQRDLEAQQGSIKQASADAKIAIAIQEKTQDETTKHSEEDYLEIYNRLIAALRLLKQSPDIVYKYMPSPAVSSSVAAVAVSQPRSVNASYCEEPGSDPCLVRRQFFDSALLDANAVDGYAHWVSEEHFPKGN
jgi:hypothetical protein